MPNTKTIILGLIFSSFLASCANQGAIFKLNNPLSTQENLLNSQPSAAAIPTQCSAELLYPAVLREEPLKVMVYDSTTSYSNIPAELVWSETKIQVEPARYAQETEPAQYEEFEDTIEVERARSELYATATESQTVVREILINPKHRRWKEGCLATETNACLETLENEFAKISTQVIKEPAKINQRSIPARTIKVKRKKLIKAGKGIGQPLPARYETIKIVRVSKPWKVISSIVPAQYETLTINRKLRDDRLVLMPVACSANLNLEQIKQIQTALLQNGQVLTVSGTLDRATLTALHAFQAANRLAIGAISRETLRKLGLA